MGVVLLVSLAPLVGCGDGKIGRYPVTGSVQLDGKPYPGARVLLVPIGGDEKFQKERPFGVTDQDGRFDLTTFIKGDGAPAGDYQVMIRTGSPKNKEQAQQWGQRPKIDRKYGKPTTSGLTATIDSAPTELPPFEVTAAARR